MRYVAYLTIIGLTGIIVHLTQVMVLHPFTNRNMGQAYFYGCNLSARPLTEAKVAECKKVAKMFVETLDSFDKQLEMRY
jgi:hypothetical protein